MNPKIALPYIFCIKLYFSIFFTSSCNHFSSLLYIFCIKLYFSIFFTSSCNHFSSLLYIFCIKLYFLVFFTLLCNHFWSLDPLQFSKGTFPSLLLAWYVRQPSSLRSSFSILIENTWKIIRIYHINIIYRNKWYN